MSTDMVPVADLTDIDDAGGRTVVSEDGRAIALFYHEEEIHAVVDILLRLKPEESQAVGS